MFSNGIVIPPLRLMYFFIPKAACSSLKKVWADFLRLDIPNNGYNVHAVAFTRIKPFQFPAMDGYRGFAVVRNPYSRLWSLYKNKLHPNLQNNAYCRGGVEQAVFGKYGGMFRGDMTFEQFVYTIGRIPYDNADAHFCPQSLQLPEEIEVFRMENMAPVRKFLAECGIEHLPHRNRTKKEDWRSQYTPEMQEEMRQYYRQDFEKYGYDDIIG